MFLLLRQMNIGKKANDESLNCSNLPLHNISDFYKSISLQKQFLFEECPSGRKMLTVGKHMPILCSLENSMEDDMCPQGYECLSSVTTDNGKSYHICCTEI